MAHSHDQSGRHTLVHTHQHSHQHVHAHEHVHRHGDVEHAHPHEHEHAHPHEHRHEHEHHSVTHQHTDELHFVPVGPAAHEPHAHPELGSASHADEPHDHDH